jgi:hypothetical protein
MACCLAVALLIAVVRGAWFRLFPARRPARAGFAPPARRPAPGPVLSGAVAAASVELGAGGAGPPRRASVRTRAGFLLVGGLLGVAGYAATAELAIGTGLVQAAPMERLVVVVTALAVAAVLAARQRRRGRLDLAVDGRGDRVRLERRRGSGLIGAGAGWSVASVVDMHLLGLVSLGAGHLPGSHLPDAGHLSGSGHLPGSGHLTTAPGMADMPGMSIAAGHEFAPAGLLLHSPGLAAVALGCLLALGAELRRPSRSPLSPRPWRAT